jgi:hypothetical protein
MCRVPLIQHPTPVFFFTLSFVSACSCTTRAVTDESVGSKYLLRKNVGDVEEEAILEHSARRTRQAPQQLGGRAGATVRRELDAAPPDTAAHVRSLGQAGHGHDRQQQRANKLATRGHHTNRSGREMNGAGGLASPPTHVCPCEAGAPNPRSTWGCSPPPHVRVRTGALATPATPRRKSSLVEWLHACPLLMLASHRSCVYFCPLLIDAWCGMP